MTELLEAHDEIQNQKNEKRKATYTQTRTHANQSKCCPSKTVGRNGRKLTSTRERDTHTHNDDNVTK
jgi:hypothetical protein